MPAILSAILAYQVGRRRASEDRRQRAKEIATALLVELRYIEGPLRSMYSEQWPLNYWWYVPLPWFEKLFPDARYFSPSTVRAAYDFYGLILELHARRETGAKLQKLEAGDHYEYRVKTAAAIDRLAHLVEALKAEGGVLPPLVGVKQVTQGQLPDLPPTIFPEMSVEFPEAPSTGRAVPTDA